MIGEAWKILGTWSAKKSISVEKLISFGRGQSVVAARRKVIREIRENTNLSLSEIGMIFGGRDHSTILHYLNCEGWVK